MSLSIPTIAIVAVLGLLAIGFYGLLAVRNLIKVMIALQIVVKGMLIGFVLAGHLSGQINLGQSLAILVIIVDTLVAVIGLAFAVQVRKHFGTLDVKALTTLRR